MNTGSVRKTGFFKAIIKRNRVLAGLLPEGTGILFFFIIPFIVMAEYALTMSGVSKTGFSFGNLFQTFHVKAFFTAFRHTLEITAGACFVLIPLSLILSAVVNHRKQGRSLIQTILLIPIIMPSAVTASLLKFLIPERTLLNAGTGFIILILVWKILGCCILVISESLLRLSREQTEAAELEGGSRVKIFFRIKLPYLMPAFLFTILLVLLYASRIFREVYLLYGDYPHQKVYLLAHFLNNMERSLNYGMMSSAALWITAATAALAWLLFVLETKAGDGIEQ